MRLVVFKFVIPAPIFIGINSSRNREVLSLRFWIFIPRFRKDKFHEKDTLMP